MFNPPIQNSGGVETPPTPPLFGAPVPRTQDSMEILVSPSYSRWNGDRRVSLVLRIAWRSSCLPRIQDGMEIFVSSSYSGWDGEPRVILVLRMGWRSSCLPRTQDGMEILVSSSYSG